MEEREVVTCFLRHEGAILLCCRSEAVGSYPGRWGAVAGHAEGDPDGAARDEIREETGLDPQQDVTLVRRGDSFAVTDDERGTRWLVTPFLFDSETRAVDPNWETERYEWVAPTAILDRETVPDLWESYDRVRPSVETIARDREHGAAYISVRALEVLRDESALAAERGDDLSGVVAVARDLLSARPSMSVLANRVNRVMYAARDAESPRAVEHAASAAIADAVGADRRAAEHAAGRLTGRRVATLSRSGTVLDALRIGDPAAVLVAESRPGGEGVGVAETLADDCEVTLTTDAGFGHALLTWDADLLLVGADTVLGDGRVVNKVGTRPAAVSASLEGIEVVVAAAVDKVSRETNVDLEPRDPVDLYDGPADLSVLNRTFDVTPPECVDAIVTEWGVLDATAVSEVIERHRERADW